MKTTKWITLMTAAFFSLVAPALAENAARQDDSNVLVWMFLGACALIIFMQLVPVVSLAFGLIRGSSSGAEDEAELEPVTSKYR